MPGPEINTVVEMLRANPTLAGADVLQMRAGMAAASANAPMPEGVACTPVEASAGFAGEWTAAGGVRNDACLIYFHGGGYVMGSIATHRGLVAGLSKATGVRALSVDYRLGPEHPFPAAVDDAVAAYCHVRSLGIPASRIVLGGDSAGGGLTAATLLALRQRALPMPAAALLISPWVDLTQSSGTMQSKAAEDPMVDAAALTQMAAAYLNGADPKTPLASPIFADLSGLPPLLVQVGTAEVLLDDARGFAANAERAGVKCTLEEWEQMIHVWHAFALLLPEGAQAIEKAGAFLASHLG